MIQTKPITDVNIETLKLFKQGKVRSVYDFSDQLLIVASDRISAFDYILKEGVPTKGQVLTELSEFWFKKYENIVGNHLISTNFNDFPSEVQPYRHILENRSMLVKKTQLIEIECVVRGYIIGSGWKEYQSSGTVCGIKLPAGLKLAEKLPEPIFTPAFKASDGHDENITIKRMNEIVGESVGKKLAEMSLELYKNAAEYALEKNIILADTKFEFGWLNNEIILIDEVFTPDSSRFWPINGYEAGASPASYDKQIVRDYLESLSWNKQEPVPPLPAEIIQKTAQKYNEIKKLIIN